MILAASIGVAALAQSRNWKRALPYAGGFAAVAGLLAAAAWPAADGTFVSRFNFSPEHLIEICGKAFASAFTGELISSLVIVAAVGPLAVAWRRTGFLYHRERLVVQCLCGRLFPGVALRNAVSCVDRRVVDLVWTGGRKVAYHLRRHLANMPRLLAIVIAVQCYWTWCAVRYDWNEPYSGSLAAAQGLRELRLEGRRIYAIGFACVAVQPYFPRNLFSELERRPRPEAYWDWSVGKTMSTKTACASDQSHPDYVIIGYKNEFERDIWTDSARKSGYRAIRHFEGNSFWESGMFEPESFDLYRWDVGR